MRHPSCAESDRAIWELYSFDRPRSELPGDSSIRRRAEKSVCPRRNHAPITANPQRACRQSSRARIQEIAFHGSAQIVVGLAHGVNAAFVRHFCKRVGCRVALRSASPLRILATRPIFGPGGWVARLRPPFWPHFSRLRVSNRRTLLYSRPLPELSRQRSVLHAANACTRGNECLPERRSAF